MNPFANIQTLVIAVAAALLIGFSSGYYTKGEFVKAEQTELLAEAHHQVAVDIKEGLKESASIEAAVSVSDNQVGKIRKIVSNRITKKVETHAPDAPSCDPYSARLDTYDVVLLDAARSGSTAIPAEFGDGAFNSPSDITVTALIDNDLEVVGLYQELAIRHDALVDWVLEEIEKQSR